MYLYNYLSVLQDGLGENFESVSVNVVDCPDLTKEPFTLAAPGKGTQKHKVIFTKDGKQGRLRNKHVTTRGFFCNFPKFFAPGQFFCTQVCVRTRGNLLLTRGKFAPGPCLFPSLMARDYSLAALRSFILAATCIRVNFTMGVINIYCRRTECPVYRDLISVELQICSIYFLHRNITVKVLNWKINPHKESDFLKFAKLNPDKFNPFTISAPSKSPL